MKDLEKYMLDHRDVFDSADPDPGHFDRFEQRLAAGTARATAGISRFTMLRIAALILLLITVTVFVFDFAGQAIRRLVVAGQATAELPAEIKEAIQYYDNQTNKQLGTLKELATAHPGSGIISASVLAEIKNLDASTDELRSMLAADPGNERILDAIVQNQQMKESVVKAMVGQLSQKN